MRYFLTSPQLEQFPEIKHAFTTTLLKDDYDRIAVKLKVLSSQIYYVDQIHSNRVVYLSSSMSLADMPAADAIVTDRKNVYIGVRTADCVPILVFDPERQIVAAIHAGYKGLLNGVIQNTINLMTSNFSSKPENLTVTIGPHICVDHYEVGFEVIQMFRDRYHERFVFTMEPGSKPHLNLSHTALMILEDCGVDPDNLEDLNLCTYENEDLFFSYRRQKEAAGRQFNCIGIKSDF